jgi:hypothetical protein
MNAVLLLIIVALVIIVVSLARRLASERMEDTLTPEYEAEVNQFSQTFELYTIFRDMAGKVVDRKLVETVLLTDPDGPKRAMELSKMVKSWHR